MAKSARVWTLAAIAAGILLASLIDWRWRAHLPYALLGVFPVMLAASYLPDWLVASLGAAATLLGAATGSPGIALQALSLAACGLLYGELLRHYRQGGQMDQTLRFLAETIPSAVAPASNRTMDHSLNSREARVLYFVAQGLANKEIAARMEISESQVKGTLQRLFARTKVRTRAQLVRVAVDRYSELLCEPQESPGKIARTRYSIKVSQAWEQAASGR